jgi:hypothetical protein
MERLYSRAEVGRFFCAENLYDVFVNVRDDEGEHCKTMRACQTAGEKPLRASFCVTFQVCVVGSFTSQKEVLIFRKFPRQGRDLWSEKPSWHVCQGMPQSRQV